MAHVEIRQATLDDALQIARHVRPADVAEIAAQTLQHPYYSMVRGLEADAVRTMTGLIDGVPVCMWGVAPAGLILKVGHPWMVATTHLDDDLNAKIFLRRCRKPVMALMAGYDTLVNYVDARNTRAIEWLRWCGFTIHDPEPYGLTRLPFHKFTMQRGEKHV